jgi:hypothetical protein
MRRCEKLLQEKQPTFCLQKHFNCNITTISKNKQNVNQFYKIQTKILIIINLLKGEIISYIHIFIFQTESTNFKKTI